MFWDDGPHPRPIGPLCFCVVGQIAQTTVANIEDYFAKRSSDNVLVRPETS
ncbi:hypothetical protein [Streptomyces griseoluteus]|uniref:hypothetical protein n=1 Tax=Streptomyces griseoluteus TaxID=29306 RepID=UPI0036A0B5E8